MSGGSAVAPADLLTPIPDDIDRAWRRQRALRIGEQLGWYTYLAGDRRVGQYALKLPDGTTRLLNRNHVATRNGSEVRRDEVLPWLCGMATAKGIPHVFDDIEPAPIMLDPGTAARQLGVSLVALNVRVMSGKLVPLYIARRERRFYNTEIQAATGDPGERAEWTKLREHLPSTVRLDQVSITETPGPQPLPVAPAMTETPRCIAALMLAATMDWLRYVHGGLDVYTVQVRDEQFKLPGLAVLPWVWGLGDGHGQGARVAYR